MNKSSVSFSQFRASTKVSVQTKFLPPIALKSLHILAKAVPGGGGTAATGGGGGGMSAGPAPLALASKYLRNHPGTGIPSGRLRSAMLKNEKKKIQTRKQRKVLMAFGE